MSDEVEENEFDLPFEILSFPGSDAVRGWSDLGKVANGAYWPVILGGQDELQNLREYFELRTPEGVERSLERMRLSNRYNSWSEAEWARCRQEMMTRFPPESPKSIVERAREFDPRQWLANKFAESQAAGFADIGTWPDREPQKQSLTAIWNIGTETLKEVVYIAKIPTPHSYEVPAYLRFGGWNDCPNMVEQVAIHRYWHDLYGSQIVSLSGDVIECFVRQPPTTRDEAIALAYDQFAYCYDIVVQGTWTISNLAASLVAGHSWYFWWD